MANTLYSNKVKLIVLAKEISPAPAEEKQRDLEKVSGFKTSLLQMSEPAATAGDSLQFYSVYNTFLFIYMNKKLWFDIHLE